MKCVRATVILLLFLALPSSAATFTVTNTNDSGPGSLRQAILDSNAAGAPATIAFAIGSGPHIITPQTPLPFITKPTAIDATTQPGYGGVPLIGVDGSLMIGTAPDHAGFVLAADGSSVIGFSITSFHVPNYFDGVEGSGVIVKGAGTVQKCYLGISLDGKTIAGNDAGVRIDGAGALIGGPGAGNVIGGNGNDGIAHWHGTGPNVIQGNTIGMDATGLNPAPNTYGMFVSGSTQVVGNIVGGNLYGEMLLTGTGNVAKANVIGIAGTFGYEPAVSIYQGFGNHASTIFGGPNPGDGNDVTGASTGLYLSANANTVIQGNSIHGTGTAIYIEQTTGSTIQGNTINNSGTAVVIRSGAANTISENSMFSNYGGIQLGTSIPLPNDSGDLDGGANLGQNYPIITSAKIINGQTVISGTLNSQSSSAFTIEFFGTPDCNASGYGEGKTFAGSTTVSTDASGNASFTYTSAIIFQGQVITATATDSLGNTSEFSACHVVDGVGTFVMASAALSVSEGAGSATITVNRTSGTVGSASVSYETVNETATAGSDYTAVSGTLAFADGESSKTITVPIIDDSAIEGTESFLVNLTVVTNGATIGTPRTTTVSILDNEQLPTMTVADVRMNEGNSGTTNMTFTAILSHSLAVPATVQYSTSSSSATAGSDFQSVSGTLTFNPGETQKTIDVPIIGDTLGEADEAFFLNFFSPTNVTLVRSFAAGTIVNDDPAPTVTASDVRIVEGDSGTTNAVITLTASQPFYGEVDYFTVDGTAKSGSDYVSKSGAVGFNFETTRTISIPIIGDTQPEPDEAFTVHLSIFTYSGPLFVLTKTDANVVIATDDAGIGPSQLNIASGSNGQLTASFGSTTTPQTITLSSSDPSVATVPASAQITGSGAIEVTALQPGHSTITATLPPAFGSVVTLIDVYVYEPANLVLTPATIAVPVGVSATISASFKPALTIAEGASLKITGNGIITLPDRVLIDPAQTSTFTIKGVTPGFLLLTATLGSNHGNATTTISVQVTEPPTTPTIIQISPANGPASGGTSITLGGANLRADCTIRFGGVPATNIAFLSATSMTATTPGHGAGATDVSLVCGADTFNLANAFTYLAGSATLSGVSPSFGTTAGGTVVRITGTNLTNGCWPYFDTSAARTAYLVGPTEMIAATPAHPVAATVPLMLRCGSAPDVSLADAFTYSSADSSPVITTIDPLVGSAGKTVTISGARFRLDDVVTFDTTPAVVLSTTPGTHVVRIPELPLGKTSITVTDLAGHSSTTGPIFTIVEPQPPQITSVSPTSTRPGNEVSLDGSGFRPSYSFTIGDQPATLVSMTYTRAVVRVPQLAAGNYGVNVLNAAAKIAAIGPQVTVLAPGLAITRMTPSCVTTEGDTRITISGAGFANGAVVTFDGTTAGTAVVADAQTINVVLPPLPTGMPRIVVTNPNGDSASLSNGLNVVSPFDPAGCAPRGHPARH